MSNVTFATLLDRHFKMNQDYLLDLVGDLLQREKNLEVVPNYYEGVQENEMNPKMRTKLIEWMIQLADDIKLGYKTKQMAIIIVDVILSKLKIHKRYLQLLGIATIFITVKSEESFIYTLSHACEHCANAYTKEEVSAMEMLILKTLKWKLQYPTPGEIARRLVQLVNEFLEVNLSKFFKKVDNFIDLAISEFDASIFPPSSVAAAAVMCTFEGSLAHVEKWRILMSENFGLEFEGKIDILYENIMQKLLKFYPEYLNEKSEQPEQIGGAPEQIEVGDCNEMQLQNNNEYPDPDQALAMDNTNTMFGGMNMNGQEASCMETLSQDYGMQNNNGQYGQGGGAMDDAY